MNQPDLNKNKRFAELVGICWCEPEYYNEDIDKCHKCGAIYSTGRRSTAHPDFAADPRIVLEGDDEGRIGRSFQTKSVHVSTSQISGLLIIRQWKHLKLSIMNTSSTPPVN